MFRLGHFLLCALMTLSACQLTHENASADSGSLYDWSTGRYHSLDVDSRGNNKYDVYDWETGRNYDVKVKPNGRTAEVYDWSSGQYRDYDIKRKPSGKVEIYDWQSGKEYEFDAD